MTAKYDTTDADGRRAGQIAYNSVNDGQEGAA
jgi:hypothetical protein